MRVNLKKFLFFTGLFIVLFIIGYNAANQLNRDTTVKRSRFYFGTLVEIEIRDSDKEKSEKILSEAFDEFSRIENMLTTYDTAGIVWKMNSSRDSLFEVIPEIYQLIEECIRISKITDGGFDVAIDTLISLWGFGKEIQSIPDSRILTDALYASGIKNIGLGENNIVFRDNNTKFNFGAIAAGYAVDRVLEILKKNGVKSALVNGGGEISTLGAGWNIGIQHPRIPGAIVEKIQLNGYSVATSGDYEQFFEADGKRYHHILDPSSGKPAMECQSVTVLAENNTLADALATGIFVLGPEKGMQLVEKLDNVEALIIDKDGIITKSRGFNKFLLR